MNKNTLLPAIFVTVLVVIGLVFFLPNGMQGNTSVEHNMEGMNRNPVAQSLKGYDIAVTSDILGIQPNKNTTIIYQIKNDKGEIIKNYDVVHEKNMHFIAVRKDLKYFQHLHPEYNEATGEFSVDITFPTDGPYRIFPDFTPSLDNPQKLPVTVNTDINVGNLSNYSAEPVTPDSQATKAYGEYNVTTSFPENPPIEVTYSLNISKNNQPVTNLEKYLGALGHSVIIKEGSLDFIHTHASEPENGQQEHGSGQHDSTQSSSGATGPEINFTTTFPEGGIYKIFTQFQHEGKVQTTDYTVQIN
jgi:hypothetical protein